MKTLIRPFAVFVSWLVGCGSCMNIQPITPPPDPPRQPGVDNVCKPPPIEKNIIGTWRFQSDNVTEYSGESGTVTFLADGKVVDPDSLFSTKIELGPVISKTYDPVYTVPHQAAQGAKVFAVFHQTRQGRSVMYYTLVSNECNRIHTRLRRSAQDRYGFILTR